MSVVNSTISSLCLCLLLITVNGAKLCTREEEVRCMVSPCMVSECPAVPQATCQSNYCGGCNAEFYLNGVRLHSIDCQGGAPSSDRLRGLANKPNSERRPILSKDDTEHLDRRNANQATPFGFRGNGWRNSPPRLPGSRDRQNRGNGPNFRPFRGFGGARPSPRSPFDPNIPPQQPQRPNSQPLPGQRSSSSSSSSRRGQNRRPSRFRNFVRSRFRKYGS